MTVVIATRDRGPELATTLRMLDALPEGPPIIVVDNGSTDGSPELVRTHFPHVPVIALGGNLGAVARNLGVEAAGTSYVAFSDDDSWWAAGSLERAADVLDRHPDVAVVAGRVLVGAEERLDETSAAMSASPLPVADGFPGRRVLGFLSCGAVVRRRAFLEVGGFDDLLFFLGEEELLAYDLASRGWQLAYVDDVVAHHHPSPVRDPDARRTRQARNQLLVAVMRRPVVVVWRAFWHLAVRALHDPTARAALSEFAVRAPRALHRRRTPAASVEEDLRLL